MSDWQSVCIGDIANIPKKQPIANPQAIELLTVRLYAKGVERTGKYPRATERGRPYFARDAGEILIGRQNFHNGGIGIVSKADHGLICSNAITSLIPADLADKNFLFYLLSSSEFRKSIQKQSEGTGQSEISETKILSLELALPPLPEQKKIAEILSGIDRSISINTNKINSLETLYTSLLADSLRRIPGECLEMQLADACTEVFLGLTSKVDYVEGEGIPLVRASNIRNGLIDFDSARHISHDQHLSLTKYRKATKGDVLATKSGSLGECAIVHSEREFSIYESIVCLKPKSGILTAEYLFHAMQCSAVKDQFLSGKVGSAVAHLNLNDFRRITLPLPSLDDQKIISKTLDAVQSSKGRLREDTNRKILLRNALSSDLLSGRKRVSV